MQASQTRVDNAHTTLQNGCPLPKLAAGSLSKSNEQAKPNWHRQRDAPYRAGVSLAIVTTVEVEFELQVSSIFQQI